MKDEDLVQLALLAEIEDNTSTVKQPTLASVIADVIFLVVNGIISLADLIIALGKLVIP